ncbi:hypothetical protein JCM13304A_12960 [Desulfothermus okinawensis JCM 13304]
MNLLNEKIEQQNDIIDIIIIKKEDKVFIEIFIVCLPNIFQRDISIL